MRSRTTGSSRTRAVIPFTTRARTWFSPTSGAAPTSRDSSPTSTQTYAHIPGWTDFRIDDVTGSLFGSTPLSTKYPTSASFRAAMLSFMNAVGPALRAKGWFVGVNASINDNAIESATGPAWDGTQYIWWVKQIAADIDGITMEHWQQTWNSGDPVRTSGSTGSQGWDGWQRLPSLQCRAWGSSSIRSAMAH